MKVYSLFLLSFILGTSTLSAQRAKGRDALWEQQLKAFVDTSGNVNYAAWRKESGVLDDYIQVLQEQAPQPQWTKNQRLAYWINAYNALTVQLILRHYPVESIQKIRKPWDTSVFFIDGASYTLNAIEHDILRKMGEPRIHFAINCASASCPKLAQKPYTSRGLEQELQAATKAFLCDSNKNTLTQETVYLSKIFLWFSEDFGSKKERLAWLTKQTGIDVSKARIRYLTYDWSLNE